MTDVMHASGLGHLLDIEDLRHRTSEINSLHSMRVMTLLSCRHHWLPDTPDSRGLVNSVNLSLLAKAFVLWSDPNGRPLRLAADDSSEELWFLRAANSLPWYSPSDFGDTPDATMIAFLVRQAYLIYVLNDPVDGLIARNFVMFHDLVSEVSAPVRDIASEFFNVVGISLDDMWVVLYAIYAYYFVLARNDPRQWSFSSTFFSDTPQDDRLNGVLASILQRTARPVDQLRDIYNTDCKYRDVSGRTGSWVTEFNILRDFPIVQLEEDLFCCPFPPFVIRRAIQGFYYDLLEAISKPELIR